MLVNAATWLLITAAAEGGHAAFIPSYKCWLPPINSPTLLHHINVFFSPSVELPFGSNKFKLQHRINTHFHLLIQGVVVASSCCCACCCGTLNFSFLAPKHSPPFCLVTASQALAGSIPELGEPCLPFALLGLELSLLHHYDAPMK